MGDQDCVVYARDLGSDFLHDFLPTSKCWRRTDNQDYRLMTHTAQLFRDPPPRREPDDGTVQQEELRHERIVPVLSLLGRCRDPCCDPTDEVIGWKNNFDSYEMN